MPVCWSLGGDEASRVHPAAAVESDSGSEPSGAGAADAERAVPGQSGSGFPPWTFEVHFSQQMKWVNLTYNTIVGILVFLTRDRTSSLDSGLHKIG